MSRVRIVRGKYTKISKENYNLSAEGSIKTFANGQIIENGKEKGVAFGNYQRLGSDVNDDFDIKFSLRKKDYETVVPMGILDYSGKYENALFAFDYTLSGSNVEKIKFEIIDENGEVIFSETTLPEIIISVNKREKIKKKLGNTLEKCLKDSNYSIKTWCWKDIYKEESIPSDDKTKIGSYIIFWDVRVQMLWQEKSNDKTPWLRLVQPHAGGGKGFYFVPEIGEEVLVGFEGGNAEKPYIIGTHYNGKEKSGYADNDNKIKSIHTRSGHLVKFTEEESIIITDKSGNEIHLDTTGGNINITAPNTMTLNAKTLNINVAENMTTSVGMNATETIGMAHLLNVGFCS